MKERAREMMCAETVGWIPGVAEVNGLNMICLKGVAYLISFSLCPHDCLVKAKHYFLPCAVS